MSKPSLVIMAAGMGSRYGSLKQIDPVGPWGEIIMDYSIFDAMQAGFKKIVFVISESMEKDFKEIIGNRIAKKVSTAYAVQRIANIPQEFAVPEGRTKPWGTGHAVLSCKGIIDGPFAVINADDYYGQEAFKLLYNELTCESRTNRDCCMVGFKLKNTVSQSGYVSRGICQVDKNGFLTEIVERTRIQTNNDNIAYSSDGENWEALDPNSTVSMNCWGFMPGMLAHLEEHFKQFLRQDKAFLQKSEYFLPSVVDALIKQNRLRTKVLSSGDKWYGVTYKEDKAQVVEAINQMIASGKYPERIS